MQQATPATFATRLFDRTRMERIADGLAVALAVSLPWSASATSILAALWLIAVLPTLDRSRLREIVLSPAGGLPILFTLLALLGVLWSQVPIGERFISVVPFARLLAIPLLMCQFARSPRGVFAIYGLVASCAALLVVSYWSYAAGASGWYPFTPKQIGIPIRDSIVQSGLFTICIFALLGIATDLWARQRRHLAAGLLLLAMAFLANIVLVATSRTALVIIVVLLVLYALRRSNWKAAAAVLVLGALLAGIAWTSSDYLRVRVSNVFKEIHDYETLNQTTSSGQRLELWSNALKIVAQAPVIGYGTGSLAATYKAATSGERTVIPDADNPHNQTFTVAIQLGLVGVIVLYALWLSHLLLFRGGDWVAWFGMVLVVQSAVGSLTNSYLFDFVPGWTYAVCVGVAGGMMLRRRADSATPTPRS